MIVSCSQMRDAEELAFSRGRSAALLMSLAGEGLGQMLAQFFPKPGSLIIYLGKGNNGGDALVASRSLIESGWDAFVRLTVPVSELADLPKEHFEELEEMNLIEVLGDDDNLDYLPHPLVLLDGLLGIGAKGPLRGELAVAAEEMNATRKLYGATTVAVDIPSGINGDTGEPYPGAVVADMTATICAAKSGLLADQALAHVGRIAVIPLPEIPVEEVEGEVDRMVFTARGTGHILPRREFSMHKGSAGRVAVIAGSSDFPGAAALASAAAVRTGAGLVTLYVREGDHSMIAAKTIPEVMVRSVADYREVMDLQADVLALGPGLGSDNSDELLDVILNDPRPMVVDADGLNIIAAAGADKLDKAKGARILTPHPGEMARLLNLSGPADLGDRAKVVNDFTAKFPNTTLLLKGARTIVGQYGKPLSYNTTGNPGMASGGMGDVLTGVIAALMAQGVRKFDASCLASWIMGRTAEGIVWSGEQSEESLTSGDIVRWLGHAFYDFRQGVF